MALAGYTCFQSLSQLLPLRLMLREEAVSHSQSKRKRNLECTFSRIGCLGGKDMHPKQNGFTWCKTRYPTLELFNEAVQAGELQRKQIARKGVREGTHCSACLQCYDSEDFPYRRVVAQQSWTTTKYGKTAFEFLQNNPNLRVWWCSKKSAESFEMWLHSKEALRSVHLQMNRVKKANDVRNGV
mmetsp:Transcript_38643/g.75924  ORF Transcript_38643/g.75924 Transcript_38643/m.75924 type:complete len:184 (+) Transcript_38643:793-1344(+)